MIIFTREAAYNLALIFVFTGAAPLADALYRRWLSIWNCICTPRLSTIIGNGAKSWFELLADISTQDFWQVQLTSWWVFAVSHWMASNNLYLSIVLRLIFYACKSTSSSILLTLATSFEVWTRQAWDALISKDITNSQSLRTPNILCAYTCIQLD